jgi:hypothetical protein
MATTTTNFGWDIPQSTDLVKDGATAIAALGQDIDTALVDLKGGTTGQVLAKASGTDMDFSWVAQDDSNAIQNAIVDAKGDLIAATAADTPARLAIGANGTILTADSSEATGMKWAAAAGGGKILQVVYANSTTSTSIGSATFTDTTLSATITPSSASSKVLIMVQQIFQNSRSAAQTSIASRILRDSTSIYSPAPSFFEQGNYNIDGANSVEVMANIPMDYVDSPSTTSAVTYKTQARPTGTSTCVAQPNSSYSSIVLLEIGA